MDRTTNLRTDSPAGQRLAPRAGRILAARPRVEIRDPGSRLPVGCAEWFPLDAEGVLVAVDRRVPIHPKTIERLARTVRTGQAAHFTPEIPISTELGLPRYEPLVHWLPKRVARPGIVERVARRLLRRPHPGAPLIPSTAGSRAITETSVDEQVHYFADHFAAICPKPGQVSVVVSNTCNLKCVMCPYHSPEVKPTHTTGYFDHKQVMSWELMDRIATECGELAAPVKVGNIEEPLLHPRMLDFVRACRSRGVPSFHITTNGLPLDERRIRDLLDAGLTSVYISVDAARPDTYQRVRGASLAKVENNIRMFVRIRDELRSPCTVRTSFVKNKGVALEEADEFRERWCNEADGVILYNLAEFEQGNSRFTEVHRFAEEKMRAAGGRWPCLNPFQEIYLLPDGRVYYCCETVSKLAFEQLRSMGDYPTQTISAIWQGELFTKLRRDLIHNRLEDWSACAGCGIWMSHAAQFETTKNRRVTRNMITEIIDVVR